MTFTSVHPRGGGDLVLSSETPRFQDNRTHNLNSGAFKPKHWVPASAGMNGVGL